METTILHVLWYLFIGYSISMLSFIFERQTYLEKIISFLEEKLPCFIIGHLYTRKLSSGEAIYLNNDGPLVEYTCSKCGKKENFSA